MPLRKNAGDEPGRPRLIATWYGIGALQLVAVTVLSLVPMSDTGVNDKLSHLVTYFVLAGWFGLLAANRAGLVWTFAAIVAYGGLIELLQAMTAHRQAEWADLLANSIGAGIGIWLYFTPLRRLLLFVDRSLARVFQR